MPAWIQYHEHFPTSLARDLAGMVIGDSEGAGTFRHIYSHAHDKDLIVKIENGYRSFHNVTEWEVWKSIKSTDLAKWFAPCVEISGNGIVLIMKRAKPIPRAKLPARVPAFFTDLKAENWGWYKGHPVCVDYGLHLLHENGMTKRMRKANWT